MVFFGFDAPIEFLALDLENDDIRRTGQVREFLEFRPRPTGAKQQPVETSSPRSKRFANGVEARQPLIRGLAGAAIGSRRRLTGFRLMRLSTGRGHALPGGTCPRAAHESPAIVLLNPVKKRIRAGSAG
jgi:hypothetical protein